MLTIEHRYAEPALFQPAHVRMAPAGLAVPANPFKDSLRVPSREAIEGVRVHYGGIPVHGRRVLVLHCRAATDGWKASVAARDPCGDFRRKVRIAPRKDEIAALRVDLPRGTTEIDVEVELRSSRGYPDRRRAPPLSAKLSLFDSSRLADFADRCGTDKGFTKSWNVEDGGHGYALVYQPLFTELREKRFTLLEIGLDTATQFTGRPAAAPSLSLWRRWLPHASLVGFDMNDFSSVKIPRTRILRGDQSRRDDLHACIAAAPAEGFRVVIDDGSHASSHQQISLATLFPAVSPGGVYVIEDLHWQPKAETPTTLAVLERLAATGRFESPFVTAAEARRLEREIAAISIARPHRGIMAVLRRAAPTAGEATAPPRRAKRRRATGRRTAVAAKV